MTSEPSFNTQSRLPVGLAFRVLRILSDQRLILGSDEWRHTTGDDSLASIDSTLAQTVLKQPPSKFGHTAAPSLWTATHFTLALPTLSYTLAKYGKEDETTRNLVLPKAQLEKYFIAFPYIVKHYQEYKALKALFGEPSHGWWTTTLNAAFGQHADGAPATVLLASLPQYLQDRAAEVLSEQGDSLTGRIVLAYLLSQGTHPEALPFDSRTESYLAPMNNTAPEQTLFDRLITALLEIGQLDAYLDTFEHEQSLRLSDLIGLVSWFGRPHLVEMVLPRLTGAAEPAIRALTGLFAQIARDGGPDYSAPRLVEVPAIEKFRNTQSLATIGRLSIIKDILSSADSPGQPDGMVLRQLAQQLYSDKDRADAWGSTAYYIPDARRASGFVTFRQDIANIIYCAGIFTEQDGYMAGTFDPDALKLLAKKIMRAKSIQGIRQAVQANRRILDNLAIEWELHYSTHERLRILRFLRQTFGLESMSPIPIPLTELNKGFAESYLDEQTYHLRYREAGEMLAMAIPVGTQKMAAVRYQTIKNQESARVTSEGLPYSAWLEVTSKGGDTPIVIPVPGRGSFDPFGRVGSPHAGEVIGFGCSVHHASLAIILAELASLGARKHDLTQVAARFMRINRQMHERHDLASFQLAQITAAFIDGKPYTHRDHIMAIDGVIPDTSRPYLASYARPGKKPLSWAEPQVARLSFGYPTLYPAREPVRVSPRYSWYNGSSVELPECAMKWQALA